MTDHLYSMYNAGARPQQQAYSPLLKAGAITIINGMNAADRSAYAG